MVTVGLARSRRALDVPSVYQCTSSAAALENEAGFGAIDAHLFHLGIRQMLRQRAERGDGGKYSAPQMLRFFLAPSR
jgi:hypothetical protein